MKQLHLHQRHIENSVHYPGLGLFLDWSDCCHHHHLHRFEQLHCFHHYPDFEGLRCCKNYPNYHLKHIGNSVLRIEIDLFLDWSDCCHHHHLHRFEQLHCFHHYPDFEGLRCCKSHLYHHQRHIVSFD